MVVYSHSRISCYENCPYQYKLKYIDRIKPEIQNTIESFMGDIVHRCLEKLYKDLRFQKLNSKEEIIEYFNELWEKEYSNDILIVKEDYSAENYKEMGEKILSDYYNKYKPFNDLTILGLETQDKFCLPDGNMWHVRIDKFACDKEGNYYVCDYKTNSRMKEQEAADSDRQLAMYSFWVRDKFKDAKSIKLVWYMLAFNKEVVSERTEEQLERLQNEVMEKIKEIESATEFPRCVSALCDYCGYKKICPSFKHKLEVNEKPIEEFNSDDGVRFVNELARIKNEIKLLEDKQEELKKKIIDFSKQKGVEVVYGSNMKCGLKSYKKVVYPDDKTELINLLKKKNLWDEFSMINYSRFSSKAVKGEIDSELSSLCSFKEDYRINLGRIKW